MKKEGESHLHTYQPLPPKASPVMGGLMQAPKLILASRSPRRRALLAQLGVAFTIQQADIDETPLKHEAPLAYVKRIARTKALTIAAQNPGCVVLAADTPVLVGRRILQNPETVQEAAAMLKLQSNRRVTISTAVVVVDAKGKVREALVPGWIKVKRLSAEEIAAWIASGEWKGTAGGIKLEFMESWVVKLFGSVSAIHGLPLYETAKLLKAAGVEIPATLRKEEVGG
jgi:septum formation protein